MKPKCKHDWRSDGRTYSNCIKCGKDRHNVFSYWFSDNCWLASLKGSSEYLSIFVDKDEVHFTRYVVPGRYDIYSFRLVLTERCYRYHYCLHMQYFSDCDIPIGKAVRQFKADLKKKKVQELIKLARQNKFCDRVIPQLLHYFRKDKLL